MRVKTFYLNISILFLLNCATNAQNVKISGFVRDALSGVLKINPTVAIWTTPSS